VLAGRGVLAAAVDGVVALAALGVVVINKLQLNDLYSLYGFKLI
jgi:hypothetical protein